VVPVSQRRMDIGHTVKRGSKMKMVDLKGQDLKYVMEILKYIVREDVHSLRVAVDFDGFKVSVNGSIWTPGYGIRKD
jgi:hypothetical protein